MSKETKIMIAVAVLILAAGIILFIKAGPGSQPQAGQAVDANSLVRDTSHMTGKKEAKVTLVEFGDFQCPACALAEPKVEEILNAYKDDPDFNFVFRNFPLSQHQNAQIAAEAAEAAGAQNKYWEMHNKLYATQPEWETSPNPLDLYVKYATELGLNVDQFKSEVSSSKYKDIISADMSDGNNLAVNATPTFYLNGVKLDSMPDLNSFKSKVEELKQK